MEQVIPFVKMNGCGNDFVIIDNRDKSVNLNQNQIIKLADRNNSITKGCDQLIILKHSFTADVSMDIYNTDGSKAQACGNATRCVAKLLSNKPLFPPKTRIEIIDRVLTCVIQENGIAVDMGKAVSCVEVDLGSEYAKLGQAISVNVGNPHCIFFVDDAEKIDLAYWGPKIENHTAFPERTNAEFVSKIQDAKFRVCVWERGAGITKACGSGAVAVAWALRKSGNKNSTFFMQMEGGELEIFIEEDESIIMYGPTELEFEGTIQL